MPMLTQALILSGPTHEYLDPVRFIGNASSGLMGKALAEEAVRRGYAVEFISGPVASSNLPDLGPHGNIHRVTSADEMLAAATPLFHPAAAIVFAAAVADYAPAQRSREKMPKSAASLTLMLRPTPDIAQTLCRNKRREQTAIGFALQTVDAERNAREKLLQKNLDGIVLNSPATLGAETGTFRFLEHGNDAFQAWGLIDKPTCARYIFDAIERRKAS